MYINNEAEVQKKHFPKEPVRITENLHTPAFPREKDLKILQHTRKELLIIENEYTGRKGIVAQMIKRITSLTPEERPRAGQLLNQIKKEFQDALIKKEKEFSLSFRLISLIRTKNKYMIL